MPFSGIADRDQALQSHTTLLLQPPLQIRTGVMYSQLERGRKSATPDLKTCQIPVG